MKRGKNRQAAKRGLCEDPLSMLEFAALLEQLANSEFYGDCTVKIKGGKIAFVAVTQTFTPDAFRAYLSR